MTQFVDSPPPRGVSAQFIDTPPPKGVTSKFVDGPPPAAAKAAPASSPVQSPVQPDEDALARSALEGAQGAFKGVGQAANTARVAGYSAIHGPLQAVDAVLGAPQRFLSGSANADNHEALDLQHPAHAAAQAKAWIGHGLDVALHPFDERKQDTNIEATLHTLGMAPLLEKFNAYIEKSGQPDFLKHFETPTMRLGAVLASQLLTDPTSLIAPLKIASEAAHVATTANTASKAAKAILGTDNAFRPMQKLAESVGRQGIGKKIKDVFARRPELDEHLDPMGKAARLSIEEKVEHGFFMPQAVADHALLTKAGGKLTPDVENRVLQNAYVHGDVTMRQHAVGMGYKPSAAEQKLPPMAHHSFNVADAIHDLQAGAITPEKWLAKSRHEIAHTIVDQKSDYHFNKATVPGSATPRTGYGGGKQPGPVDVSKLSYSSPPLTKSVLTKMGKMGTASIMGNPLPHGLKNVGDLAYLAGGPRAYGSGLAYASKGLDPPQLQRMLNMGMAPPDYLASIHGPLSAIMAPGQHVLNRLELGYRQGLLDHYDAVMGPSKSIADDYAKADLIRRDLGDYRNVSAFVRGLQAIGGPFVAFRIGTVPSAVGRTALNNPQRLESLARPDIDVNSDTHLMGKSPSEAVTGGPPEDFAKLLTNPDDYITSPSTAGPAGQIYQQYKSIKAGYGEKLENTAAQLAESYVPGAAVAHSAAQFYSATGLPGSGVAQKLSDAAYGSAPGVSPLQEALYSLYGGYYKKRPSGRTRTQAIRHIENPR